jgi:hypothetical protein
MIYIHALQFFKGSIATITDSGNNEINRYFCVAIECHHIFTKENTYLLIFSASRSIAIEK